MQELFENAGFEPRVGFNVGTGALSLTLTVPPHPMDTAPNTDSNGEAITDSNGGANTDSNGGAEILRQSPYTGYNAPYSALMWAMLGLHPHQRLLEEAFVLGRVYAPKP